MRAAVFKEFGKPLSIEEVREPKEGIILKVLATGLCHGDIHIIMGDWKYDIKIETPRILGHEIVGEIINDFGNFKRGDRVLVYNSVGCGKCKYCKLGHYQYCERVKVIGLHMDGGYAEYVSIPSDKILLKVEGNPVELAPLADAGITAYNSVKGINKEDKVLLIGTGAVALLALQILKSRGVSVTIAGHNEIKLSKAKELGADEIVIAKDRSIAHSIATRSSRLKFDYVIDYVGSEDTLSDILWLLNREGELRIVGEFGGTLNTPEQLVVLRGLKIRGILYGTFNDLVNVYNLYKEGKIKTLAVPYKLEDINEAINDLMRGRIVGRAIIIP
ncbi:alcohol dehydrogenase catalytic domain-containing protein [Saccharolobus caldissimus]|uniref:Alcohol dehydrogenase n=1 Tax=Saccharolobus caldissimus TaxID=1702097 RepID=A0AAQ4CSQ5_9CREN|nr:alcohol dehydrogenase catalytic domain-containing protein [Saccharolobus caldissimus]BDB98836.1 alcohol dehydrogenase [Saccharolobus caldissimus]